MRPYRVLVVHDRPDLVEFLRREVADPRLELVPLTSEETSPERLAAQPADILVASLELQALDGWELLRRLRERRPETPYVVVTERIETVIEAIRAGAADYIAYPFHRDHIRIKIERAILQLGLYREMGELRAQAAGRAGLGGLVGKSRAMRELFELVRRVADSAATVLVEGESGTGKELVARAIHQEGARRAGPFVAASCAGLPETLLESELFGYKKGAFTGATVEKKGLFEAARGGTLFLDEIGEIPPSFQSRLLRVLQEREVRPLGATEGTKLDLRVVASTQLDLRAEVAAGRFREDLFYRVAVIPIHLPPLRERREDVPLLAEQFLARHARAAGRPPPALSPAALDRLMDHDWPGNVRELENLIERLVLVTPGARIEAGALPREIAGPAARSPEDRLSLREALERETAGLERETILRALREAEGNRSRAAKLLKISRGSLYNKMRKLGI